MATGLKSTVTSQAHKHKPNHLPRAVVLHLIPSTGCIGKNPQKQGEHEVVGHFSLFLQAKHTRVISHPTQCNTQTRKSHRNHLFGQVTHEWIHADNLRPKP